MDRGSSASTASMRTYLAKPHERERLVAMARIGGHSKEGKKYRDVKTPDSRAMGDLKCHGCGTVHAFKELLPWMDAVQFLRKQPKVKCNTVAQQALQVRAIGAATSNPLIDRQRQLVKGDGAGAGTAAGEMGTRLVGRVCRNVLHLVDEYTTGVNTSSHPMDGSPEYNEYAKLCAERFQSFLKWWKRKHGPIASNLKPNTTVEPSMATLASQSFQAATRINATKATWIRLGSPDVTKPGWDTADVEVECHRNKPKDGKEAKEDHVLSPTAIKRTTFDGSFFTGANCQSQYRTEDGVLKKCKMIVTLTSRSSAAFEVVEIAPKKWGIVRRGAAADAAANSRVQASLTLLLPGVSGVKRPFNRSEAAEDSDDSGFFD
jgi:hypothetical protein